MCYLGYRLGGLGHEGNMFLFSFKSPFYHLLNPLTSGEGLFFVWAKLEAQVSWPWGWLFLFRTIIALEQVFCTIIKGFCCDFFFISLQKMFKSFPVPYSNVDMSQGLGNVFNQVEIFTLSNFYLVRLPNLLGPRESHSKCKSGNQKKSHHLIPQVHNGKNHRKNCESCPSHFTPPSTYDNTHWGETI